MSEEHHCKSTLVVRTSTWVRDSHELFDYEAEHINAKRFLLCRSSKVFRNNTECSILKDEDQLPQSGDYLLSIKVLPDGRYAVIPAEKNLGGPDRNLSAKKVWMVVRDMPAKSHQLQPNDLVKLGRFKLRVKQIVKAGDPVPEIRLDETETPVTEPTVEEAKTMQCRICLLEGGNQDDPLICPCQCRGSIKYIHLECLRHWINGRLNINDTDTLKDTFFFRQLHCELCRSSLPSAASIRGQRIRIVRLPKIPPPFLVLENLYGSSYRGVHIITMAEKKGVKLGRGHESDVRIADVSISRYHATIRLIDDSFFLEDHKSKFGTLVSVRRMQFVDPAHELFLQVGRTVISLCVDENVIAPVGGVLELPVDNISSPDKCPIENYDYDNQNEETSQTNLQISGNSQGMDNGIIQDNNLVGDFFSHSVVSSSSQLSTFNHYMERELFSKKILRRVTPNNQVFEYLATLAFN